MQKPETGKVIIMNGEVINNLQFALDTVLLASSQQDIQTLLVCRTLWKAGPDLNIRKTKLLIISKLQNVKSSLFENGIKLEQVDQIIYLWYQLNCSCDSHEQHLKRSTMICLEGTLNCHCRFSCFLTRSNFMVSNLGLWIKVSKTTCVVVL